MREHYPSVEGVRLIMERPSAFVVSPVYHLLHAVLLYDIGERQRLCQSIVIRRGDFWHKRREHLVKGCGLCDLAHCRDVQSRTRIDKRACSKDLTGTACKQRVVEGHCVLPCYFRMQHVVTCKKVLACHKGVIVLEVGRRVNLRSLAQFTDALLERRIACTAFTLTND